MPAGEFWSVASGRNGPGRSLVGRASRARGLRSGISTARRSRAGRPPESKQNRNRGLCSCYQQYGLGCRARKHRPFRSSFWSSEGIRGQCVADRGRRSGVPHGANGKASAEAVGPGPERNRHSPREVRAHDVGEDAPNLETDGTALTLVDQGDQAPPLQPPKREGRPCAAEEDERTIVSGRCPSIPATRNFLRSSFRSPTTYFLSIFSAPGFFRFW